jgi:hypothetical protein
MGWLEVTSAQRLLKEKFSASKFLTSCQLVVLTDCKLYISSWFQLS